MNWGEISRDYIIFNNDMNLVLLYIFLHQFVFFNKIFIDSIRKTTLNKILKINSDVISEILSKSKWNCNDLRVC